MLMQVDSDGFSTTFMEAIVDRQKDESTEIPKSERYIVTRREKDGWGSKLQVGSC